MTNKIINFCLCLLFFPLIAVTSFSCSNENDEIYNDDDDSTYCTVSDTYHGWEQGISSKEAYLLAHYEESDGLIYYLLGDKINKYECVYIFDENPNLCQIGNRDDMWSIERRDNELYALKGTSDEVCMTKIRQLNKVSSRSFSELVRDELVKYFLEHIDFGEAGYVIDVLNVGNELHDEQWAKAMLTTISAGISMTIKGPTGMIASLSIDVIKETYDASVKMLHDVLYGDAEIEIVSMEDRADGGFNICVSIQNINTIPKTLTVNYTDYNGCKQVSTANDVYAEVIGRDFFDPTYVTMDFRSGEICVEDARDKDSASLNFVVYPGDGYDIRVRPALISYLDFLERPLFSWNGDQVKLGTAKLLITPGVDYKFATHYIGCKAKYGEDGYYDKTLDLQLEFEAQCNSYTKTNISVIDWGLCIIQKGHVLAKFSMVSESDDLNSEDLSHRTRTYTLYLDEEDLQINYDIHEATPKEPFYIQTYMDYIINNQWIPIKETIISEPKPIQIVYSAQPSFKFLNAEYGYTDNGAMFPNSNISWGNLNLVSFFETDWQLTGLLFIKNTFVTKVGDGWNKDSSAWVNFGDNQWDRHYVDFSHDGYGYCSVFAFACNTSWGSTHNHNTSGNLCYAQHDLLIEILEESNVTLNSENRLSFKPITKESDADQTHIAGYRPVIE